MRLAVSGLTITDGSGLTPDLALIRSISMIPRLDRWDGRAFAHRARVARPDAHGPQPVDQNVAAGALDTADETPFDRDKAAGFKLLGAGVDPGARPADVPGHRQLAYFKMSVPRG